MDNILDIITIYENASYLHKIHVRKDMDGWLHLKIIDWMDLFGIKNMIKLTT